MRLLLVRHAIAEPAAAGGDRARALSDEGRARFLAASLPWLARHAPFDRLLHSPWRRAAQTAELMRALVGGGGAPESCAALAAPPDAAALGALAGARVAAVGHQPWLAGLAALACFGDEALGAAFALRKGGGILLEGEARPGAMRLRELFAPPAR